MTLHSNCAWSSRRRSATAWQRVDKQSMIIWTSASFENEKKSTSMAAIYNRDTGMSIMQKISFLQNISIFHEEEFSTLSSCKSYCYPPEEVITSIISFYPFPTGANNFFCQKSAFSPQIHLHTMAESRSIITRYCVIPTFLHTVRTSS